MTKYPQAFIYNKEQGVFFMYDESIVIYSDILFLINFSLDFLCLFISSRLLHRKSRVWRWAVASLFGGLYAFLPYLAELDIYLSLPLHIASATVICLIAFGFGDAKGLLLAVLTFIASSALLGGLITAFYSLIGGYSNGIYREIDSLSFLIICVLSALFALLYSLICRKRIDIRSAEIRIKIGKDFVRARLLCDSGNLVTEPFSALPVIVLSSTCLPPPYDNPESELFPQTIRAIPFSTSSGAGCFFGFRPERIELLRPARKPKLIDAYIGIDTERKSYSGYDGLIPTSVL